MTNIEKQMKQLIKPNGVCPGISVAYGTQNVYYMKQLGTDGAGSALDNNTLFDLASVTKFFLAIVYLHLQEKGIINLESSIASHTEKFAKIERLKIREILSYNVQLKTVKRIDECTSYEEAMDIVNSVEGYYSIIQEYSDIPSIVLAILLSEVTGRSFGEWIIELLIEPLDLKNTGWSSDFLRERHCCSYEGEKWLMQEQLYEKNNSIGIVNDPKAKILSNRGMNLCGNAGLFSSTEDIITIAMALLNEKILSRESLLQLAEGNGWDKAGEKQTFGYLCYRRYEDEKQTEVPHILSRYAVAASGFTGCYFMMDPINKVFAFIGGNRLSNCVSKNQSCYEEKDGIIEVCGSRLRSSVNYVYDRDILRDCICQKAIEI